MITKPMLAETVDDASLLTFPIYASPKLDGIRCLIVNEQAVSRKFKLIPNNHIRCSLEGLCQTGFSFDGELTVGDTFHSSSSGVMSESGTPNFTYHVFDTVSYDLNKPFEDRYNALKKYTEKLNNPRIKLVEHRLIHSVEELLAYEAECLTNGYEGLMVRKPSGRYKNGRSTVKEGLLLKIKQFTDFEAKIIGFEERMHNANEATIDELGHTKRSSHQENMIPTDTLGSLILQTEDGVVFKCGTGFDDTLRKTIWSNQSSYLGKMAKIKSQEAGKKDKPRFPVYLGIRHLDDM